MKKLPTEKEPFKYTYTRPSLDWYENVDVEIKWDDHYYFKLSRRFGPSWWLIGTSPVEEPRYHWEETSIGEISITDLRRFIEWAKDEHGGSRITGVNAICGSFDILKEITELLKT